MKDFLKILAQNSAVVILVLGIVAAINFISHKFPKRLDLTEDREYTLSDSTFQVLERLEDRLTVKLFYSKDLPAPLKPVQEHVSDVLGELKARARHGIHIETVEPDLNEEKEHEALSIGISPLQINVIEKDKQEVKKAYMGMALYYQDKREVIPVVAPVQSLEYMIALAVLKLTQKEEPRVGLYAPEDNENYQIIKKLVGQMGTLVQIKKPELDLADLNLDVFVMVDPVEMGKDFLQKIDEAIEKGMNVLVFAGLVSVDINLNVEAKSTGLDEWLSQKGVGLSDKLLLDPRQNGQASFQTGFVQVFMNYPFWVKAFKTELNQENPITAQLEEVLFPWTNVIQVMEEKDSDWHITELVRSSQFSFLQPGDSPNVHPQYLSEMQELPVTQSYPLSVMLTKKEREDAGRIFLTATSHALMDQFLDQLQSNSNAIFLANMLEYSSWGDFLIGVRSRGKTARPLVPLTPAKKSLIKWGLMLGVPLVAIGLGLLTLLILKKRRESWVRALGV